MWSSLRYPLARLYAWSRRLTLDRDFEQEIESHIALLTDDGVRRGLTPDEARRTARLRFGHAPSIKDRHRDVRALLALDTLLQDVAYAFRGLRRDASFSVFAVFILALGIGATTAMFAFVDAALIRPLPYRDPSALVALFERTPLGPRFHLSYLDYLDWRQLNTTFDAIEAYEPHGFMVTTERGAQYAPGARVSAGFFRTLGSAPLLGRDFLVDEDRLGAPGAVILSYASWQTRFGGRVDVLGESVALDGVPHTIVGVMPQDFHFSPAEPTEYWTALHDSCADDRGCHNLAGLGRLARGTSLEQAAADITSIANRLAGQFPGTNRDRSATVMPLTALVVGDVRPILLVLLGGGGLLLAIAVVNVASLLLVRSAGRTREIAVRGALGASRGRLWRQFATEGAVLVGGSTAIGMSAAYTGIRSLAKLIPPAQLASLPYLRDLGFNARVIGVALAVSGSIAVLLALIPSGFVSRSGWRSGMEAGSRGASRRTRRFNSYLVVLELTLATVLLVVAGLLAQSVYRLLDADFGLQSDHLATLRVSGQRSLGLTTEAMVARQRQIVDRVASLPGVQSVGLSGQLPLGSGNGTTVIRILGRAAGAGPYDVIDRQVGPGYFTTLHARVLQGRDFIDADDLSKPRVAIVNRAMAAHLFPNEDPLGAQVFYDGSPESAMRVVGVVNDIREGPVDTATRPVLYVPFNQGPTNRFYLTVRTSQDEHAVLPTMASAIGAIAPDMATSEGSSMRDRIRESPAVYFRRAAAWLVGGFAAVAWLLAVVGLYGVMAYAVAQRTREIAVRLALGAQRGTIYRLVLSDAMWLAAMGIGVGVACSLAAASRIQGLLVGVGWWDPATVGTITLVLTISALLASSIPARRAVSTAIVESLRAE